MIWGLKMGREEDVSATSGEADAGAPAQAAERSEVEALPGAAESGEVGLNDEVELSAEDDASNADLPPPETEEKVGALQAEAKENFNKYLRALAELENFKKRSARERAELIKYAGEGLARDILDVLDDMERAQSQSNLGSAEELMKGVKMIYDRLVTILERHSVRGESSLGQPFDPAKQEALASFASADYKPGIVIEEHRKAYFFKDRLLRPGQVVVSAATPAAGGAAENAAEQVVGDEDHTENES